MNKKIRTFALLFWLFSFPTEFSHAKSPLTLTIAQDEAYAGTASYAEIRSFIIAALKPIGIELKMITLPLERGSIACSKGEVDGQLARFPLGLRAYPGLRATSFPFISITVRFIYLKSNLEFDENNLEKYMGAGPLNNHGIVTKKFKYTQVFKPDQALSMLESKRVDYILLPEMIIRDLLNENPELEKKSTISKRLFTTIPLHFILNDKNSYLLPQIEEALRIALNKNSANYPLIKDSLNGGALPFKPSK